ncbi:unnamed protein product [Pedinophyceae sp. YPF-701]|nr:unnamed protein product [Pedinophyceae sp. YPF-701]
MTNEEGQRWPVCGHTVAFPTQPYGVQLSLMSTMLRALDSQQNALLSAPTGCGKTLALLSAALSWQGQAANAKSRSVGPAEAGAGAPSTRRQRVFYASRTHGQVSQVVAELKRLEHTPRMAVLASRAQYCVHPDVRESPSRDADCDQLCKQDACSFAQGKKGLIELMTGTLHDVEELAGVGELTGGCPYFAARSMAEDAEVVLCPYQYLIDPLVRGAMNVDLEGAVVIVDEAHNIENACMEAASVEVPLEDLDNAAVRLEEEASFANPFLYQPLSEAFRKLHVWAQRVWSTLSRDGTPHITWTGPECIGTFENLGITADATAQLLGHIEQIKEKLREEADAAQEVGMHGRGRRGRRPSSRARGAGGSQGKAEGIKSVLPMCERLLTCLQMAFDSPEGESNLRHFTFAIFGKSSEEFRGAGRRGYQRYDIPCFALWCNWGGVAFRQVHQPAHSVLLASGTLAPMEGFETELGCKFPHRIDTPHVVPRDQVYASVIPAHNGHDIVATYKNVGTVAFKDVIGDLLKQVVSSCKSGGVIVFVASYGMLAQLRERWAATGLLADVESLAPCFMEQRGQMDDVIGLYRKHANSSRAVLIAVARGKASEGIDFRDAECRVCMCVGLPFPSITDPKVKSKVAHNDAQAPLGQKGSWYTHQAFRAMNQAAGRCIRHRKDYGALILVDSRFQRPQNVAMLPRWVQSCLKQSYSSSEVLPELEDFLATVPSLVGAGETTACCGQRLASGGEPGAGGPKPNQQLVGRSRPEIQADVDVLCSYICEELEWEAQHITGQ